MNLRLLLLLAVFLVSLPGTTVAREVRLKKGEVYRDRDLAVICEGRQQAAGLGLPIALHECQYWDSFSNTCDYKSKCTFYAQQEAFVLKTCTEFDDNSRKCLKTREEKIGAGR